MTWKQQLRWALTFGVAVLASLSNGSNHTAARPNIVFILTDDQDVHMNSLDFMPLLQQHLVKQGTSYKRNYCTISLCCPSRTNLWTGKFSHNTNVTDLSPPYGGYPKFMANGYNDAYIPIWLQAAGYSTYYVGKFLNYHNIGNYDKPFPAGWTGTDFLVEPYTYMYNNPGFQRNHDPPVNCSGHYTTDLVTDKTLAYLDDAVHGSEPFFLVTAPIAPHANADIEGYLRNGTFIETGGFTSSPVSAPRYANMFSDVVIPRTPSFNPPEPNGVGWISQLPRQNQTVVDYNDEWYRNRLRALQSVDDLIDKVVTRLDAHGVLDNTYIIYTTDNGYHIGQHRLEPGKQCFYQEDVNIPLIIRGPGVDANRSTEIVTSMTDLAPTFLSLGGAPLRDQFDGSPIPVRSADLSAVEGERVAFTEHVNIEQWGIAQPEGKYGKPWQQNSTYKALRVIGGGYDLLYTVWCTGDHELYNLVTDPYEMHNLYPLQSSQSTGNCSAANAMCSTPGSPSWTRRLVARLDALVLVGKTCEADSCRNPWGVLHPQGNVHNLNEAMAEQYDQFYEERENKVQFKECPQGYLIDNELPIAVVPFEMDRL